MVTPRTGKQRGPQKTDFLQDPERFATALALAFQSLGTSETGSWEAVSGLLLGTKVSEEEVAPRRIRGRGAIPGGTRITYHRNGIPGGTAANFKGKADTIRKKAKRAGDDPKAGAWLLQMQAAFAMALAASFNRERCAAQIMELADKVNRGILAESLLLNALSAWLPGIAPDV
jgi:hypothetical protein